MFSDPNSERNKYETPDNSDSHTHTAHCAHAHASRAHGEGRVSGKCDAYEQHAGEEETARLPGGLKEDVDDRRAREDGAGGAVRQLEFAWVDGG
jgi:hypothetical protein